MSIPEDDDVPYGENFHDEAAALAWAAAASGKRPWRATIFELFAAAVLGSAVRAPRILELGSGPGFLAEHVLNRCPSVAHYTLLDFAEPMLAQSRHRLLHHRDRTRFERADFKREAWAASLGHPFDFVFSLQAVHELRHKRHAPRLYEQIHSVLSAKGELVVCDHLPEGAHTSSHTVLYMSIAENLAALERAGFSAPALLWSEHRMAMYRAERGA